MTTTVRVPPALEPLFEQAEAYVKRHFDELVRAPERGTILVGDERYVLVRAKSLTVGFFNSMRDVMGPDEALRFWYRMARLLGEEDARAFCAARHLEDPAARLSTGPVHFAYTGWARVEIDDRSKPASDGTYYLEYTHPNTFESASWLAEGQRAEGPVCMFSAGYSAGWCSHAFDLEVHAREVTCVACGDAECRFVMGSWDRLDGYADALRARLGIKPRPATAAPELTKAASTAKRPTTR
jgi:predicted hydrocarbon binding protein